MIRSRETAAFICSHVFAATRPILLVVHDEGDWQFLCGDEHPGEKPHVVGINHLHERDATLASLTDLPDNWEAERAAEGAPWMRRPIGGG